MDDDYDEDKGWEGDAADGDVSITTASIHLLVNNVNHFVTILSQKEEKRQWKIRRKF